MDYAVSLDDIRAAEARVRPLLAPTPLLRSTALDALAGRALHFKCESFQKTGSFKARGALSAVRALSAADASRGVVTHSSGNHAQALAWAASTRGIPAHVVMPTNAPEAKRRAVLGYGGRITPCEPTLAARLAGCAAVQAATGATLVPPYDHPLVIAGQGTLALELAVELPSMSHVIVPVGGGGLVSGIALALHRQQSMLLDDSVLDRLEELDLGALPPLRSLLDSYLAWYRAESQAGRLPIGPKKTSESARVLRMERLGAPQS